MVKTIMKNSRASFLLAFIGIVFILLGAVYLQFYEQLEPCSLCITQRIVFFIIALILLSAIIHWPARRGYLIYAGLVSFFSLIGLYFAGRQVWLQHLPADQIPGCGPGLSILFAHFPVQAVKELLTGSAQCAVVTWQFWGLSLAAWAFIFFFMLLVLGVVQFFRVGQSQ
jgi:disulfide bond formation protein DsbB